jgi:DNA-binding transcriptional LysR family regulator
MHTYCAILHLALMTTWDDVRLVLALLRTPSSERAAELLGVDRSTISRRLAAIEKALGATLFARTRDGHRPTAAVLRLRPHAEAMEQAARALEAAVGDAAAGTAITGRVRVASTEGLAAMLVADGLLDVSRAHPALDVEVIGGNRPVDLANDEADIALRMATVREAALRVRCLARVGIGLFASYTYVGARGAPQQQAIARGGLAGHDVLLPAGELARLPEARWLAARKGVRVALRSNAMPALIAAAVAGHGIVALDLSWGRANKELAELAVLDHIPRRPVWLVTRSETPERAAIRVGRERIAAIVARRMGGTNTM